MTMILARLSAAERLDGMRLPASIGPLATLSEELEVPDGVDDPTTWVESHILPQSSNTESKEAQRQKRQPREVIGYKFFERWDVAKHVNRHLKPSALPGVHERAARGISHYVRGSSELLLMEPVIGDRVALSDDLTSISQTFITWRALLKERAPKVTRPHFVAYVMGSVEGLKEARAVLATSADEVIDVSSHRPRQEFLEHIKRVASTGGGGQMPLLH
jgi:hypothetical protein